MNKDIRDTSVEKGWKSMLPMLDTEMPLKKQRRNLIWWWLLAALVAGFVSLWKYSAHFFEPVNNSVPRQQDVSVPMASLLQASKVTQLAAAGTGVCLNNTGEVENSRFRVLDEGAFEGNIGLNCPKESCRTGSKRCVFGPACIFQTHPGQPGSRIVPSSTFPPSTEHTSLVARSGALNEMETGMKYSQIAPSDSTLSGGSDSYSVLDMPSLTCLQQVKADIISTGGARQTVQPVCTDISPVSIPTNKKGRAGISVGAIAGRSLTGASAGFLYTRHIGRRLAARGGLSMSVFSPSRSTRPVLMFSDQDYLRATNYAFESNDQFGNAVQSQDVFTQTGQFVEVPVKSWIAAELTAMVQYKLTRKLWLQTGAVGSLTARSIIAPLNYTGGVVLQPDRSALSSLESLAGPVIRKFTPDWITGVSWFGGRHIEWSLNVRVPLNSDIKYRKLAYSAMSAGNYVFDKESANLFTGSGASALLTATAIWNF